jgi:hypothetical protein
MVESLGLLVVTIMLMGLISALSMGVFERAREIGILLGRLWFTRACWRSCGTRPRSASQRTSRLPFR